MARGIGTLDSVEPGQTRRGVVPKQKGGSGETRVPPERKRGKVHWAGRGCRCQASAAASALDVAAAAAPCTAGLGRHWKRMRMKME